ncbi:MAG: DUF5312 family protein [Treponema sp.]|jgi:hypothetical protein|nr:DUF5312 family protein [Treponema sp.]
MPDDIINRVFSFITGDNESISDKDILLKQTIKDLGQNKYSKFYRVKTEEIDPSFAQYMYIIYKAVYTAQVFLRKPAKAEQLKRLALERSMSPEVLDLIQRLSPESLELRAKSTGPADLSRQLQEEYTLLTDAFDQDRIDEINKCNNLISAFSQFVLFDYAGLLKKFDSSLLEGIFTAPLKFSPLKAENALEEINNFYSLVLVMEPREDWKNIFAIIKGAKGPDILPLEQWLALLTNLNDLKQSKIIELTVRHATKNPVWDPKPRVPNERLIETWLEKKQDEIQEYIFGIASKQRNAQISVLARAIFAEIDTTRLIFYNEKAGKIYKRPDLNGFSYAAALNYLVAFIDDFLSKEVQEICDIILIRGQWSSNNASLQMSEAFHAILDVAPKTGLLDETLSEKGSNGPRLRAALLRIDRDKTQARYINNILAEVDDEALEIIRAAVKNLITVGKYVKGLSDDIQKKQSELIINWKELDGFSRSPLAPRLLESYKKINYFVQLMTLTTKPVESAASS